VSAGVVSACILFAIELRHLIEDYGQIAIARLDARLQSLDSERRAKLRAARAKDPSGKRRPGAG
jgi:hypothetical protein